MTLKQVAENHGLTPEGVDYALRQYQIILCEITHGMLSKLSYDAHDVIRYAQDRWCDTCELKESNGWISVKDRLPEESGRYLVYAKEGEIETHRTIAPFQKAFHLTCRMAYWKVTHWMPLPEPPNEGK